MPEPMTNDLRDASPRILRDLRVYISTRIEEVEITHLVIEVSIFEAIDNPFLHGEVIFADNAGLVAILPIVGQEEVRIKFTRRGKTVEKTFACTRVKGIKKVSGESAGVVLTITSKKHLTNAVSLFSKSYSGLASDIIDSIHFNYFAEHIDVKTPSSSAHHIVFPYSKPYAAIDTVISKTFGEDGTPYFLFENLFGDKPILQSLQSMVGDARDIKNLPVLSSRKVTNKDYTGQGTRYLDDSLGVLYEYEIIKNSDTLKILSGGALLNNTIRLNVANNEWSEIEFNHSLHAPTLAPLDPYRLYTVDAKNLNSNELKPSVSLEMHNPIAYESLGVTDLNTQSDSLSLTKLDSRITRINDMIRISTYSDSDPENYQAGKSVNLIITPNKPALAGEPNDKDELFSGSYVISRIRHYIKGAEYTVSMELIRDGLSFMENN